jgi:hypothetical protein
LARWELEGEWEACWWGKAWSSEGCGPTWRGTWKHLGKRLERIVGGHQLQRLCHQGRVLGQRGQVVLPEVQQLAREIPRQVLG